MVSRHSLQQPSLSDPILRAPPADRVQLIEQLLEWRQTTIEGDTSIPLIELEQPDQLIYRPCVSHHEVQGLFDGLLRRLAVITYNPEIVVRLEPIPDEVSDEIETLDALGCSNEAGDGARDLEHDNELWVRCGSVITEASGGCSQRLLQRLKLRAQALPLATR